MTKDKMTLAEPTELEVRPDWIPEGDTTGTTMSADDIRLPRLAIAQGLSPQLTPGDSSYIDGLKMFDLYNDVTGEVYGKGPLYFVPVRHDVRRIEFKPRSEGGGIVRMDVPANDPALEWDRSVEPNLPPRATKFDEWVVFLLFDGGRSEPIVLSIKHTNKFNRKAANNLRAFIGLPHPTLGVLPIYGKRYTIASGSEKNDNGTFGVPIIKQAGVLTDGNAGRTAIAFLKSLEGKEIVTTREPGDDSFDTAAIEAQ